ncbi:MAG: (Fe-S)-binding protein [Chloroflexi bacterium]|nr:(Fe-S)-binding protein [Chloroflexota bacterium]
MFVTCIIDQLYPQVGVSVVRVLRRLGVDLAFPADQTCCGQPLYNSGYTKRARQLGQRVLKSFADSEYVVVPSGSCAAMMRVFYLDLFQDEPPMLEQARRMAPKVYEFSQFLNDVLGVEDVGSAYPGTATYHPSCHLLREMEVRDQPKRLLRAVKDLRLEDLPQEETCCGFGGTFSVKYPHISEGMLADKIANVTSTGADTLVSCDMSCLLHIEGGLSRQDSDIRVRHLAQVLDQQIPEHSTGA